MAAKAQAVNTPDAIGMAVARPAQEAASPNTVILFGSRARGDHSENSDVDLLIVCRDTPIPAESRARRAVKDYFAGNPPGSTWTSSP